MKFHWQNLEEGPIKRHLAYGRCWIGRYDKLFRPVHIEWCIPHWNSAGFSFGVNGGDGNNELQLSFGLWLFHLWLHLPFYQFPFGQWTSYKDKPMFIHEHRHFSISIHDAGVWIDFWKDEMGGWSRSDPWWKNGVAFHPLDWLFGKFNGNKETLETGECFIPMPEGSYRATYTKELWTRGRSRLRKKQTVEFWLDIPGGIPFEGKGENSWDCGEDGLFGCGADGSLENAIANAVKSTLRNRKRYGGKYTHGKLGQVMARP